MKQSIFQLIRFFFLQIGYSQLAREVCSFPSLKEKNYQLLRTQLPYLENIIKCVEMNWMSILVRVVCSYILLDGKKYIWSGCKKWPKFWQNIFLCRLTIDEMDFDINKNGGGGNKES